MSTKSIESVDNKITALPPKSYAVVFHNDDFTPMDFVIMLLIKIFDKTRGEATSLMLTVHNNGSCIVGVYTYDIAMTKKVQTDIISKKNKHPLNVSVVETPV